MIRRRLIPNSVNIVVDVVNNLPKNINPIKQNIHGNLTPNKINYSIFPFEHKTNRREF